MRWCEFKDCWVTSADDDIIRLWDTEGVLLKEFFFRGESMTAMYIDNKHELVVCAMLDRAIRGYEMDSGILVHALQSCALFCSSQHLKDAHTGATLLDRVWKCTQNLLYEHHHSSFYKSIVYYVIGFQW